VPSITGSSSSIPRSSARSLRSAHNGSEVYVFHHDGVRAPVTVYTADGTKVVEVSPSYTGGPALQ
jgi:hypothetical protein